MKNKKHWIALLLAGVMATSCFAGCGNTEQQESVSKETVENSETAKESVSTATTEAESESKNLVTTDPVTITVYCNNESKNASADANELWIFKYLEHYMSELGYDVTIDAQYVSELTAQKNLMISTGTLPDLVIGEKIHDNEIVSWGEQDGLLDWSPYVEEYMPNLASYMEDPIIRAAMEVTGEGNIYGLPKIKERNQVHTGNSCCLWINKTWLEDVGEDVPTNMEELIDVLRAFKVKIDEEELNAVPYLDAWKGLYLMNTVWNCLGYYGGASRYGNWYAMKNQEMKMPGLEDDYKEFITYLNTMYTEGLIAEDWLADDPNATKAMAAAGGCGVLGSPGLLDTIENYEDWILIPPMTTEDGSEVVVTQASIVDANYTWANPETEYPEILAIMLDHLYSEEGAVAYNYGPMQGKDPLGELDGWFFDTYGVMTCQDVVDGKYKTFAEYMYSNVVPYNGVFLIQGALVTAREMAGVTAKYETEIELTDAVTGQKFFSYPNQPLDTEKTDSANLYGKAIAYETFKDNMTLLVNPIVYKSEQDSLDLQDTYTLFTNYASSIGADLISGKVPLSEIDAVQKEFVNLGMVDWIAGYAKYFKEMGIACADYSHLK